MIKAVLYDLGDIFFEAHHWRKWMWETLKEKGRFAGDFREFYTLYDRALKPVYENRQSYWAVFNGFMKDLVQEGAEGFIEAAIEKKREFEAGRTLYKGVDTTLAALHNRKVKNIVLSDNENNEDWIREHILRRFGINNVIHGVISSVDAGAAKPDIRIFETALRVFELDKSQVLFVAHDADEINGAVEFGLKVVEFNNYLGTATRAQLRICEFSDLLNLVINS